MPYNTSAIVPSSEISGTTILPLARVKRILAVDDDIVQVSTGAAFAITIATEMFIRYFAEQAINVVRSEKKPRRNIQYKDLSKAVGLIDNLAFLEDIVPKTTTLKEFRAKKAHLKPEIDVADVTNTMVRGGNDHDPSAPTTVAEAENIQSGSEKLTRLPNGQQSIFQHYGTTAVEPAETRMDVEMA